MSLYFTKPIAREALWGGSRLAECFGYADMQAGIGQAWAFSCQKDNESPLEGGGTLGDLWRDEPTLFKSRWDTFPFIISLVAPVEDLSIQIHPDAEVAARHGYSMGKNEAWVFLEKPACGSIVYGQKTSSEKELRDMIAREEWARTLGRLSVEKDDFVYVPAGMLHALTAGCVAYEIQQATDVTYRFFDYHRKDAQGRERALHVDNAIECVDFSLGTKNAAPPAQTIETPDATITTCLQNESFCIRKLQIHGEKRLRFPGYQLMTVAQGEGRVNGHAVKKGASFLLPADETLVAAGNLTLMTTCE